MAEKEYFDNKGREIKTEVIDGVTRQSFVTNRDGNEYVSDRQMSSPTDLQSCIKDPRWKTDPHFRDAAIAMAKKASSQGVNMTSGVGNFGVLEKAMADPNSNSENILEQREAITLLFSDPRYKASPSFRREVAELVRQSDPRHLTEMPSYRYDAPVRETGQFGPAPKEETQK